jgi:hypothetical protein
MLEEVEGTIWGGDKRAREYTAPSGGGMDSYRKVRVVAHTHLQANFLPWSGGGMILQGYQN